MKVKDVIEKLKTFNQDADFIVSCDEELNTLYGDFEIGNLSLDGLQVVIAGLSGTELEEVFEEEDEGEKLEYFEPVWYEEQFDEQS